jgi:hypothetical protein
MAKPLTTDKTENDEAPATARANPPAVPITERQILATYLQATGDLDTAQTLQKTLPHWLTRCSSATLAELDSTARDLFASQTKVATDLQKLKPLHAFCMAELNSALSRRWTAVFDVTKDHLELPANDCGCTPATQEGSDPPAVAPATRTLLDAAMDNFTADEAKVDGFPAGSVVRIASRPSGVAGLTPAAFAELCRELDLGRRYQEHFQEVFGLRDKDGKVVATSGMTRDIAALKKQLLLMDTHLAFAKKNITEAAYQTMKRFIAANGVAGPQTLHYQSRPLLMQGIEALDSCIWGAVVFSQRSVEAYPDEWCLVYMANEPHRPLYEYPTFNDFKQYLTLKLGVNSYKDYFVHTIDEDDKVGFFKTFASKRNLGLIKQLPITVPLFDFMLKSHVGKLQIDARKLAVPTEDIDEEVRKKRLLNYLEIGMTVANVAGFFVPVVGQLMMGVAVGQLLAEVYEGVEDWRQGDREEAFSHLLSVAENIALMALIAGGQKTVTALVRKTVRKHADFFGQFSSIVNRAGEARLWSPQPGGYEQPLPPHAVASPETPGLFHADEKTYVRMDYETYAVAQNSVTQKWHTQHPSGADRYAPELEHNGEGGWRHSVESAEQQGNSAYTLKRIEPRLADTEDTRLNMMRRITQTLPDEVYRLSDDNQPLPPRLRDTVERFGIERRLRDFIAEMERGETASKHHVEEQLQTLPKLSGWPADRYIKLVDNEENLVTTYPPTSVQDETLSIVVTQEQADKGELLQTVIDGLYQTEVDTLLGRKTAKTDEGKQLARKLGALVKADRRPLLDHLYKQYDQRHVDDVQTLRAMHPDIPARYARKILEQSPGNERLHLRVTKRVPMGMAQKTREAANAVRRDRALAGFHLPDIANADSEKLAIQLLPRLNGWNADVRLEVRDQRLAGPLLDSIGKTPAAVENACVLVKSSLGYEAFGGDKVSLGLTPQGSDGLYDATLKALPPRQRMALGFSDPKTNDAERLRGKLLDAALDDPEATSRILSSGKYEPIPDEANCAQNDEPPVVSNHPRGLVRKVRSLYPRFTEAQAIGFLDSLGSDHLTRATRVKQLQQDLKRLRETLTTWEEDETAMKAIGGDMELVSEDRQYMTDRIEDSFRRRTFTIDENGKKIHALKLDGGRSGKLPLLPVELNFDHVRHLSLKNARQGNDVAYFLKAFKQLETLELDGNQLNLLPEVISHMPALKHLSLAGNAIKLTEQTLLKLSNLRTLQSLNLNGNPLGATPDASKMFDLQYLSLRNTGATELPKGLVCLPNLERVDLRDNVIRELPEWLFHSSRYFSEAINLRGNPLSQNSSTLLEAYRDRVGVGMGYLADDMARLDEQQARSIWLPETVGTESARRLRIWTALRDDSMAEGLFRLLAELGNTADSEKVKEDMNRRVWEVLEAAETDTTLREQLLDLAANPINCTDSAASNFSHLEVAVEIDKVTRITAEHRPTSAQLLKLGRGLFRLECLEKIALKHAKENPATDPLEVSLAYRTGLAEHFELPGQPRHMRYASLSGVTQANLETAKNTVSTAELSSEWMTFIIRQSFWSDHLRRTYPAQFATIDETYPAQLQALFEKAQTLKSADYLGQVDTIKVARETAETAVFKRLTNDALKAIDLGLCAMPDA